MTRGSDSQQKRSGDASGQESEKAKVLEGVAKPCILIGTSKKEVDCDERRYDVVPPGAPSLQPPHLAWGSSEDTWMTGTGTEQNCRHSEGFLQRHPKIQANMRSILFDWLIEVSEAYTLHRQTFYLAQDYFDRFMLTQSNIEKGVLQLIGITCLFIASKMEEARPPKLSQMAFVTADAFFEEDILQMELIILKALRWNLCPGTALSWLKLYFQLTSMNPNSDLLEPQFPQEVYLQMARLLDLCTLHINSLDFQYPVLAASVLSLFIDQETAEKVSGLPSDAVRLCVKWMTPFADTVRWFGRATLRDFATVKKEDRHNIQTHTDFLRMLEYTSKKEVIIQFPSPPNSAEKPAHAELLEVL